tara:strand:+ start:135 stop:323 length:189 start_codon:yes stop_codon:yes gene_type:complete
MEKFEELKTLVSSLEEDATKFYEKSNKAAGTRLRKGCQEVKNLCQDIRVEVSQLKNSETVSA